MPRQITHEGITYEGFDEAEWGGSQTLAVCKLERRNPEDRVMGDAYYYTYAVDNPTTAIESLKKYLRAADSSRVVTQVCIFEKIMTL